LATDESNLLREGLPPVVEPQAGASALPVWKLEDAKAKFSEVVRRARGEGPQRVTYRGKDAVVVMSTETYEHLVQQTSASSQEVGLVEFLQGLGFPDIDLHRSRDTGRDIDL
jgi:antitoxin Phd